MENRITKAELIKEVTETIKTTTEHSPSQKLVKAVIDTTLDTITEFLKQGNDVQLSGFATFETKAVETKIRRNPRTGEDIEVPAHTALHVKVSKALKDLVR